jgi:threonine/homoserine/homoserine lactone efflux protein
VNDETAVVASAMGGKVPRYGNLVRVTPEFLITALVVVATPGTGALFTLAAGLARGARASVLAAFACTLGTIPHMAAAITGLAALLHASAVAFETVKYLGVAYLLYMAFMTLREHGPLHVAAEEGPRSARQVLVAGVLANLLNPKLTIFFFAFLPQFADGVVAMTGLSLVFMAMTFAVFAVYGVFAAAVRHHVVSRPSVMAWLRRTFAGAFVLLSARLATESR